MQAKLLPWHEETWARLLAARRAGRLPHALLLTGPQGMGKQRFAENWLTGLLCEAPGADGFACGVCRGCQLRAAGNHPDYRQLTPPEEGKVIGVDQVRELIQYVALTPQYGRYKIALIHPADKLNINAANSLLKTLEEPPSHSLLMLVSARPSRLPVTVRSRCQLVHFSPPPVEAAAGWLATQVTVAAPGQLLILADRAPLLALELAAADALALRNQVLQVLERLARGELEPVAAAEAALKIGMKETLTCLYSWVCDMIRLQADSAAPGLIYQDLEQRLRELAGGVTAERLFSRLDQVTEALQFADRQLNPHLLLENVLLSWTGSGRP